MTRRMLSYRTTPFGLGRRGGGGAAIGMLDTGLRFFFHVQPPGLHQSVGMGLLNWPTWQHNPSWGQPWGGVCCRGPLKQGWKGGGQREGVGSRAAGQIIGTGWPVLEPEMRPTKGLRRSTGSSVEDKSRGRRNNETPGLANAFRAPTETCTVREMLPGLGRMGGCDNDASSAGPHTARSPRLCPEPAHMPEAAWASGITFTKPYGLGHGVAVHVWAGTRLLAAPHKASAYWAEPDARDPDQMWGRQIGPIGDGSHLRVPMRQNQHKTIPIN
jgi:hypothetical protein